MRSHSANQLMKANGVSALFSFAIYATTRRQLNQRLRLRQVTHYDSSHAVTVVVLANVATTTLLETTTAEDILSVTAVLTVNEDQSPITVCTRTVLFHYFFLLRVRCFSACSTTCSFTLRPLRRRTC